MRNKLRNSNLRVKKIFFYLGSFFSGNPMRNFFIVFISSEFLKRFFKTDVQSGVGMCGTKVLGGTHPNFKNMGSGGFRVPGKLGQSGFLLDKLWVPVTV